MGINFTLGKNEGFLDWSTFGGSTSDLTAEEATVITAAETAAALRTIANAIYDLSESVKEASVKEE